MPGSGGTVSLLRIEDTDRERLHPRGRGRDPGWHGTLDGAELGWRCHLSIFARAARHREVAPKNCWREGKAYRRCATADELTAMREEQKAAGKPMRHDGRWRDRVPGPEQDGKPRSSG